MEAIGAVIGIVLGLWLAGQTASCNKRIDAENAVNCVVALAQCKDSKRAIEYTCQLKVQERFGCDLKGAKRLERSTGGTER